MQPRIISLCNQFLLPCLYQVDDDDRDFRRARRGGVISRDSSPHTGGVAPGPKKGRTNIEPPRRTVRQRVSQRAEERR